MPTCGGRPASPAYARATGIAYAASVTPATRSDGSHSARYDGSHRADDPREPFVVGGHDVPRRVLRCRVADRVLVGAHVVAPVRALLRVVRGELPVLLRLLEPLEEAALLLALRDVQEELPDDDAV